MFELMEIAEYVYEGVVESSYKKPMRSDANRAGNRNKMRRDAALSITYSEVSESIGNHRKRYVEHPRVIYKYNCIIHDLNNSSDDCKVLGEFSSKYSKIRPTKYRGHYPATRKN